MKNQNDEYVVPFKGAKLKLKDAHQIGAGIISGCLGIIVALIIFGARHKTYSILLVTLFACVGFFGYRRLVTSSKPKET